MEPISEDGEEVGNQDSDIFIVVLSSLGSSI